jgi:hypothetical protein
VIAESVPMTEATEEVVREEMTVVVAVTEEAEEAVVHPNLL